MPPRRRRSAAPTGAVVASRGRAYAAMLDQETTEASRFGPRVFIEKFERELSESNVASDAFTDRQQVLLNVFDELFSQRLNRFVVGVERVDKALSAILERELDFLEGISFCSWKTTPKERESASSFLSAGISRRELASEAETLKTSGNQKFEAADYEGAVADYARAIRANGSDQEPSSAVLFANKSLAHLKNGDIQAALNAGAVAVALNPCVGKHHARMAYAFDAQGEYMRAAQAWERGRKALVCSHDTAMADEFAVSRQNSVKLLARAEEQAGRAERWIRVGLNLSFYANIVFNIADPGAFFKRTYSLFPRLVQIVLHVPFLSSIPDAVQCRAEDTVSLPMVANIIKSLHSAVRSHDTKLIALWGDESVHVVDGLTTLVFGALAQPTKMSMEEFYYLFTCFVGISEVVDETMHSRMFALMFGLQPLARVGLPPPVHSPTERTQLAIDIASMYERSLQHCESYFTTTQGSICKHLSPFDGFDATVNLCRFFSKHKQGGSKTEHSMIENICTLILTSTPLIDFCVRFCSTIHGQVVDPPQRGKTAFDIAVTADLRAATSACLTSLASLGNLFWPATGEGRYAAWQKGGFSAFLDMLQVIAERPASSAMRVNDGASVLASVCRSLTSDLGCLRSLLSENDLQRLRDYRPKLNDIDVRAAVAVVLRTHDGLTRKVEDLVRYCDNCARCARDLQKCAACFTTYYCNAACQHQHWPQHRVACKLKSALIKEMASLPGGNNERRAMDAAFFNFFTEKERLAQLAVMALRKGLGPNKYFVFAELSAFDPTDYKKPEVYDEDKITEFSQTMPGVTDAQSFVSDLKRQLEAKRARKQDCLICVAYFPALRLYITKRLVTDEVSGDESGDSFRIPHDT